MSTEPLKTLRQGDGQRGSQGWRFLCCFPLLATALVAFGCAPRMAGQLTALCDGRHVSQRVTIVVDSVVPHASPAIHDILGRRADLMLTLLSETGIRRCVDQSGVASWTGEIPQVLETATDPDRRLEWRIEGEDVVVAFNPLVVDNNLGMALPLRGGMGRWSLSGLAGELASGRAIPESAAVP